MSPQEMLDVLKSKVEEGKIEGSDLPRLPTIQGWKNAQTTLSIRDGNWKTFMNSFYYSKNYIINNLSSSLK